MKITTGICWPQRDVGEKVYQRTVDYPDEFNNGHHIMLDAEELATVRWEQLEAMGPPGAR